MSDFRQFVFTNRFPIIVICEPNLSASVRLSGYECFMSSTHGECSKVVVFMRRDLTYIHHPVPPDEENQYVCLTVKKNKVTFTILGVYLSPSSRLDCERLRGILTSTPHPWVITGDFNAHHFLWGSSKVNSRGRKLVSFASEHELCVSNDGSPTYLRGSAYSSCLDLTLVSRSFTRKVHWFSDLETRGSDHIPTYLTIEGLTSSKSSRALQCTDWPKFKMIMEGCCSDGSSYNLEAAIKDALQNATHSLLTSYTSYTRTDFDIELEKLRAMRRRAERRYRRTKCKEDLRLARRTQKKIQRHMDKLASRRWVSFCESLDPRKPLSLIWRTVRGLRTTFGQRHPFKSLALHLQCREIDVAESFCRRIAGDSNFTDTRMVELDHPLLSRDLRMECPFSMDELEAALALCRRSSAPGPDGITYRALCNLGDEARKALLHLYNDSWQTGTVPQAWKSSRLIPLLKAGKSPLDISSYRPIALASCVGKTMERMILTRLEWYLEHYEIYPDAMAGFRRGRSATDNVVDLVTYVEHQKACKRLCAALFLDVKGAYDNVTHEAILSALETVGLGGKIYMWVCSYLQTRSFYMTTENGPTTEYYSSRGVPQGGVLSPTLFNLTLIGLVENLPSTVRLSIYADDICIWTSGVTRLQLRARLQKAATMTSCYLRKQGLEVSCGKCAVVAFTRKPMSAYGISINGELISFSRSHRFLGVIIDRNLSWTPHVNYVKKRLTAICHMFRFLAGKKWGVPIPSMLQLYRVLFIGFLRYSLPAISNTGKTNLRTIQSIQAQALKICLGLPRSASTAETIAIAQDYSITTHIITETMRTYLRHYARTPSHHLASLAAERPRTTYSATVGQHRSSFTAGYAPASKPVFPPWCLSRPRVHLTVPGVRKKSDLPTHALKQLSLLLLYENYSNHVHIYTDGSTTSSSSGGAVVIPSQGITLRLKTSHATTSTAAELAALRSALEFIDTERPSKWAVFSDSKPALQCLRSVLRRGCHEQLTYETVKLHHHVIQKGHDIDFQWLPGHCGISGNDSADHAARASHQEANIVPIPLSRTDAARQIRQLARSLTLTEWNAPSIRHTRLHQLNPSLQLQPPSGLHRREASLLYRLWLGVAFTKAYTTLIGTTDSAACDVCGTEENIEHLLCHCPRFASERQVLSNALRRLDDRPISVQVLLEHRPHVSTAHKAVKALLCFLRRTGLCERL